MKVINLTPHVVRVVLPDGEIRVIPPSGVVARVSQMITVIGEADGIPLMRATYGPVVGLPDAQPDTIYVVSAMVRAACPGRKDVASPGDLIRDKDGQPVGCSGLILNE
jgi:hypothetical protein